MIEVISRGGPGRIAKWSRGETILETPNILFFSSRNYPLPSFAQLLIKANDEGQREIIDSCNRRLIAFPPEDYVKPTLSWLSAKGDGISRVSEDAAIVRAAPGEITNRCIGIENSSAEIVSLEGAFELRRNARLLVESIVRLREAIGPSKLIYLPGIMDPSNLAVLVYLGVDLFDSSFLIYSGNLGLLCLPEGSVPADQTSWLSPGDTCESIIKFNLESAWRELQLVKLMMKRGHLREFVELRANVNPWAVAVLRILDLEFYEYQEKYTPVTGQKIFCNSKESLYRPDVWRHRRRMLERYKPPSSKKVLLLLPCSAKKPYSFSRTHRIIENIITSIENWRVVHQVVVTSPLGLVPMELELFYPAAHYDVPVTGHWDMEERSIVVDMIRSLAKHNYVATVCHLGEEMDFVSESIDCLTTSVGSPTSRESLETLKVELARICKDLPVVSKEEDRLCQLESIARFQFGHGGEILLEGCEVRGKYPYLKIMEDDKQVAILTPERGMLSLTLRGAEKILPIRRNWVEIEDFELKGNLFVAGVRDADRSLRIGDEAVVLRDGSLKAVGIASMCGEEMVRSKRGEAVNVRHLAQE
ncbi:MAG: archaeosine synthase subunit alpha [Methanomassiliicoccales archaeon]|jgi:archaeosine synthase|nr:archaeosine synthase subunit alpha [Methanomassiliicoccales archaeon]